MSMGGGKEDKNMRRFKFDGAVKGYYDVKVFDRGDWMDWLELCHQLDQLCTSWQLTTSDEDTNKLVCIVREGIFNHDLRLFNAAFTAATQQHQQGGMLNQALTAGLGALTKRPCPFDVTTRLRQKLSDLRKTRDMPVDEYANEFEYILDLGVFVELNVSVNDQIALFHRGMPTSWRERVEFVFIRNPADALLELRTSYKVCERLEESRSPFRQSGRGGRRGRFDKRGYSKKETKQGSQSQSRHETQAKSKDDRSRQSQGKRKRESDHDKGCSYCEDQGMPFYQNHKNADCFRNPNSPSYRPNANKRFKKDTGADRKPNREMAVAQFFPAMTTIVKKI